MATADEADSGASRRVSVVCTPLAAGVTTPTRRVPGLNRHLNRDFDSGTQVFARVATDFGRVPAPSRPSGPASAGPGHARCARRAGGPPFPRDTAAERWPERIHHLTTPSRRVTTPVECGATPTTRLTHAEHSSRSAFTRVARPEHRGGRTERSGWQNRALAGRGRACTAPSASCGCQHRSLWLRQ